MLSAPLVVLLRWGILGESFESLPARRRRVVKARDNDMIAGGDRRETRCTIVKRGFETLGGTCAADVFSTECTQK